MLAAGRPWVTWPRSDGSVAWSDADHIVAIDAGTRQVTAAEAGNRILGLAALFRRAGFPHLYKKIDSTLRGHIGVEVKAALDGWRPGSLAVVAPAFPALGRTTVGGRQRVGGEPLDCPPIAEILASGGVPATTAPLADVRRGELDRLFQAGSGAIVCDAVTDADLAEIAAAGATLGERVVWVGSGGLARCLYKGTVEQPPISEARSAGPVLVVVGSLSAVSDVQRSRLADSGVSSVTVPVDALSGRDPVLEQHFREVESRLRTGTDVVVTIERTQGATNTDRTLVDSLGRMLAPLGAAIGGVIATGGDTAAALLKHWGVTGLRLIGEAEPGVPIGMADGPRPLVVALKAGAFGGDSTLAAARDAVRSLL